PTLNRPEHRSVSELCRVLALCAACGLIVSCSARSGHPASPPNVLVVAQSLDDLVSLDPAEGFELSSLQAFTSIYQRLVQPDPDEPSRLVPTLATSWAQGPT